MANTARFEMGMTHGPLFGKLVRYAIPLIIANMLQLIFNATDIAVLGILVDDKAVAAVGANSSLINLITSVFIGMASGVQVVLSRYVGAKNVDGAKRLVGSSILFAFFGGLALMVVGILGARQFLIWTNCAENVIDGAVKYLIIYSIGFPIVFMYNFLASILRAVGDTFRPMVYLFIAGVANVALNVFFILVFNLTVEGVALATIASQAIAGGLSLIAVIKSKGYSELEKKHLRFYKKELVDVVKIGLPAGIQSSLFSISNVLIQSTVNSFGEMAMAGGTISSQFDGFIYQAGHSVALSSMAFVGQNLGAKNTRRIKKVVFHSLILVSILAGLLGVIIALAGPLLSGIMTDSAEVIAISQIRLNVMGYTYFMCGMMEVLSYSVRALGKSTLSMIVSLFWGCAFRIIWLNSAYLLAPSLFMVYVSYPISWIGAIITFSACFVPLLKKIQISFGNKKVVNEEQKSSI